MRHQLAFIGKIVCVLAACTVLAACGSSSSKKKKFAYVERPVETLYAEATRALERKRYEDAIAYFEEVERQHPYSAWARRSMLMKAFAYYQGNDYDEAVTALDQFIALHPGNKDTSYAYYLKAMCFYERIRDVGRDQEYTNNAVVSLNDVIRRYPDTEYARDARLKLDLTFDHLAGKEMYIGRFYLKQNKHIAAINRFRSVIENYQTTSHVPEALHRLVEAYIELGIVDEARSAAAVLGHNYPGSVWYQDAYRLFERRNLIAGGRRLPGREVEETAAETAPSSRVESTNVVAEGEPSYTADAYASQPANKFEPVAGGALAPPAAEDTLEAQPAAEAKPKRVYDEK